MANRSKEKFFNISDNREALPDLVTVGDLVRRLQELPQDMPAFLMGGDHSLEPASCLSVRPGFLQYQKMYERGEGWLEEWSYRQAFPDERNPKVAAACGDVLVILSSPYYSPPPRINV